MNNIEICHLTSAHPRYDTRIFVKMCSSLAEIKEYKINLIVADGKGNETKNHVNIIDVGAKTGGRISRMTNTVNKIFKKAIELDCDVYHLHDPELIPIGLKLKKLGKRVIFDAHEDLPKQILGKPYLNKFIKIIISKGFEVYEKYSCKRFDYIVTATPFIRDKFLKINKNSIDINNFPIIEDSSKIINWNDKKDEICYVGGISEIRGIKEILKAIEHVPSIKLNLAGSFNDTKLENEVKKYKSWERVNELGFLNKEGVQQVYSISKIGLVTLHPTINYLDALPVKMFEYMAAGIPLISSDITLWKNIIENSNCGLCVNPLSPKKIADAIIYLISNPEIANFMGQNGRRAILEKYNWGMEKEKLYYMYQKLNYE